MALTPKQIGRAAGRIFQANIPHNWALRSQEDQEDYGVDCEIEIIDENEQATGFIFKVQIKGQEKVSIIESGKFASFSISNKRLHYYMHQLDMPIILIVVDVTTRDVYWQSLQGDHELDNRLSKSLGEGKTNISIRLPTANKLPEGRSSLTDAVAKTMSWLQITALDKIKTPISDILHNSPTQLIDDLIERNKELNFYLYIEQFERLLKERDYESLYKKSFVTFQSASELLETRFSSGIYLEKVYKHSYKEDQECQDEALFTLYSDIIKMVRQSKGAEQYRKYAIFLQRAFIINKFVDYDYHAVLTKLNTKNDPLTSWLLQNENNNLIIKTATHVQKIINSVNRMILRGVDDFFVDAISRVANTLGAYAQRLKIDSKEEQSIFLYRWLDFCLKLALGITKEKNDDAAYANILIKKCTCRVYDEEFKIYFDESKRLAENIQNEAMREELLGMLDKIYKSKSSFDQKSDPEMDIEFFTDRARKMGFKIDDPNDEVGNIIRQGLEDYNPERVIKDCEHLLMFASRSLGIPALTVGLYSASMKFLVCQKKNHILGGWKLDDIYSFAINGGFKEMYCKGCGDCKPRSDDWRWTRTWQEIQVQENKSLVERLDQW